VLLYFCGVCARERQNAGSELKLSMARPQFGEALWVDDHGKAGLEHGFL
jgi:hypothetical protein